MVGQILFAGWGWLIAVAVMVSLFPVVVWWQRVGCKRGDAVALIGTLGLCLVGVMGGLAWLHQFANMPPPRRVEDDLATCGRALDKYPPVEFQGYEKQACQRGGVDLREIELEQRAHPRQLTAREREEAEREWRTLRWGAQPYDRARFCATQGVTCLD